MAKRTIAPALADIRQDIAGEIPVDLILKWATVDKSNNNHNKLLETYRRFGIVVCTDSSGLSKLTGEKSLFEVLYLVSQPKEIIYAYGAYIGGKAIGVWAADNTEMFYDKTIRPKHVLQQMAGAQNEIRNLPIQVGMCMHTGEFWDIGGGLYGKDADLAETLAENHAGPGKLLVTKQLAQKFYLTERQQLKKSTGRNIPRTAYLYDYTAVNTRVARAVERAYPFPFDRNFFDFISSYPTKNREAILRITKKYIRRDIVILVKVIYPRRRFLLEQLTDWVLTNAVLKKIDIKRAEIETIKSNGNLGIFTAISAAEAIEYAKEIREALRINGYTVNIGIATGESLVFPMPNKEKEIAGNPVNIASKLAEDAGSPGKIYIHESVKLRKPKQAQSFKVGISGIELRGMVIE